MLTFVVLWIAIILYWPPVPKNYVLIYTTHIYDDNQHQRVVNLTKTFGDKLVVVWDNRSISTCPFVGCTCIDNYPISKTRRYDLKHAGFGNEKAMTWAIHHRHQFKRAWFIEEDVHPTSMQILKNIVEFKWRQDLVLQQIYMMLGQHKNIVPREKRILKEWKAFDASVIPISTMLNFYSTSSTFLGKLQDLFLKNNKTWMFFEGMIPTTAKYYNLSIGIWKYNFTDLHIHMKWRPCVTSFPNPGVYHPVKHRHGRLTQCERPKKQLLV